MKKILLFLVFALTASMAHAASASSYTTIPAVNAGDQYFTSQNSTGTTYNTTEAQLQAFLKTQLLGGVTFATSTGTFTVTSSGTLTLTGTGALNINGGGTLGSAAFAASSAFEPALGNPGTSGYVLSSTGTGVRSWVSVSAASGALIAANNLGDLTDTASARSHLGVIIGTNVEAWSTTLDTLAGANPFIAGNAVQFIGTYPNLTIGVPNATTLGNITTGTGSLVRSNAPTLTGTVTATGTVIAASFVGNGAALTGIASIPYTAPTNPTPLFYNSGTNEILFVDANGNISLQGFNGSTAGDLLGFTSTGFFTLNGNGTNSAGGLFQADVSDNLILSIVGGGIMDSTSSAGAPSSLLMSNGSGSGVTWTPFDSSVIGAGTVPVNGVSGYGVPINAGGMVVMAGSGFGFVVPYDPAAGGAIIRLSGQFMQNWDVCNLDAPPLGSATVLSSFVIFDDAHNKSPVVIEPAAANSSIYITVAGALSNLGNPVATKVAAPGSSTASGKAGNYSYDGTYFYFYDATTPKWRRIVWDPTF